MKLSERPERDRFSARDDVHAQNEIKMPEPNRAITYRGHKNIISIKNQVCLRALGVKVRAYHVHLCCERFLCNETNFQFVRRERKNRQ